MSNIKNLRLISIDLFRTLVPLPQTPEFLRRWYLDGKYPPAVAEKIEARAEEILARRWDAAGVDDAEFLSVRAILQDTLRELFSETKLPLEAGPVSDLILSQHRPGDLFEDAQPFLRKVAQKYPVCLSSDCDLHMVDGIEAIHRFDRVFTSEGLRAYKLNPRFFWNICDAYGLQPRQIMHIGDSRSDILAPQRLGIVTCWVNRKGNTWNGDKRPDYEVRDLLEILPILGL